VQRLLAEPLAVGPSRRHTSKRKSQSAAVMRMERTGIEPVTSGLQSCPTVRRGASVVSGNDLRLSGPAQ
jgi:hypothetical protein